MLSEEAKTIWTKQGSDAFMRRLVHETFKDARGYVEKISAEEIDSFVSAVSKHGFDSHWNRQKIPSFPSLNDLKRFLERNEIVQKAVSKFWGKK